MMSSKEDAGLTEPKLQQPQPGLGDMTAREFRLYGHQIIDWIANYLDKVEKMPVLSRVKPGEILSKLPSRPPKGSDSMDQIMSDLDRIIVPGLTHWNHPAFFAYFSISASAPGIFGELLSAAFDVNSMLWQTSPAATELEILVLDWLRQMLGLPPEFEGIIYDTASISSMHAIAAAREAVGLRIREDGMSGRDDLPLLRIYASDQAHSSIEKGVIALGLGQRALRKIPTDGNFRMDVRELDKAISEDIENGFRPFCVVATCGTTSTSSIDPIPEIAEISQKHKLWLHVDAAYAGSAGIVPELRNILDGCDRADSFVTNPHKWLFTPIDLSALYCRRMDVLRQAFALVPEYLRTETSSAVRNGMDYGVQLGRRFRALKLWMIIRYFGHEGLAARIREHCRLAEKFASWVQETPGWEIAAPRLLSLVCFRAVSDQDGESETERRERLNKLNERIMHLVNATGEAYISHTVLNGNFVMRLSVGNIRTTERHVGRAWELLREQAALELRQSCTGQP